MTVSMILMHRLLKGYERYPLPPHTITSRVFGRRRPSAFTVGGSDASQTNPLTVVLHFAYGGACGSILALSERFVRFPRVLTGVVAGLVVWAGSYLAWLPALGILSPATEHPPRRTALISRSPYRLGASAVSSSMRPAVSSNVEHPALECISVTLSGAEFSLNDC
ncbi:MAG: hypothetical protein R2849_07895 [Thermomicrobiales bacterium]